MIYGSITVANNYNQDSAAECAAIKKMIEESLINIIVNKVYPN